MQKKCEFVYTDPCLKFESGTTQDQKYQNKSKCVPIRHKNRSIKIKQLKNYFFQDPVKLKMYSCFFCKTDNQISWFLPIF